LDKKIKRLYYRKVKYSHVYAEQSRRISDKDLSQKLLEFSRSEHNQAMELLDILEDQEIHVCNLFRILVEINSAFTGMFSRILGQKIMLRYNLHLENRSIIHLKKLTDLSEEYNLVIENLIKEEQGHRIYFSS
jgi:rubrerythrin